MWKWQHKCAILATILTFSPSKMPVKRLYDTSGQTSSNITFFIPLQLQATYLLFVLIFLALYIHYNNSDFYSLKPIVRQVILCVLLTGIVYSSVLYGILVLLRMKVFKKTKNKNRRSHGLDRGIPTWKTMFYFWVTAFPSRYPRAILSIMLFCRISNEFYIIPFYRILLWTKLDLAQWVFFWTDVYSDIKIKLCWILQIHALHLCVY